MLVEKTTSQRRQKVLLGIVGGIVLVTIIMLFRSFRFSHDVLATLPPLPRSVQVAITAQSAIDIVDNPVFQRLEPSTAPVLEIGNVGRLNPFSAP